MNLFISFFFIIIFLTSCEVKNVQNIDESKIIPKSIKEKITTKKIKKKNKIIKKLYLVGDPYFIEGVEYIPEENYNYSKKGLATFYGKELHNKKTINNELNKVTELLGRHKTLPIPSIVKITNLENGLSLIIRINDRHDDNSSIIQVSRKVAQLLKFYKKKIAKVNIEIQKDASKQIKIVTLSMSDPEFDKSLDAVPTENVIETDLEDFINEDSQNNNINIDTNEFEKPIVLNSEKIIKQDLYIKVYGFKTYNNINDIINNFNNKYNITTKKEGGEFNILLGPIENTDADDLVSFFISKGYKKTEIILE